MPRVLSGVHMCGGGTGAKFPVAWAAGVLDQVGIRGRFWYDFGSRCGVVELTFSSSIERHLGFAS